MAEDKLAQLLVGEGLAVELSLIVCRRKVGHLARAGIVYQHHLGLVGSGAQSAVESGTHSPLRHIGLGDAAAYHTFKVDYEVKSHMVQEIGIDDYHRLAPFYIACFRYIHDANVPFFFDINQEPTNYFDHPHRLVSSYPQGGV